MAKLAEWQQKLLKNHKLVKRVLDTSDGRKLMEVLSEDFATYNMMAPTDRETTFNLGQRSLVDYLDTMLKAPETVLEDLNRKVARGARNE